MASPNLAGLFARATGVRPAVTGGLINGLAISSPVLVGIALGRPAEGATACLGAYVTAFTNKGGPRIPRTVGLLVVAVLNTLAFGAGVLVEPVWPLALIPVAAMVFVAAMGSAFGETMARAGTMPVTSFLAGMGGTGTSSATAAVLLVGAGGVWYALATLVLTPRPHVRQVNIAIAELYDDIAKLFPDPSSRDARTRHTTAVATLRRAEAAVAVLAGPAGDETRAAQAQTLLAVAGDLIDALAVLDALGPPVDAVSAEYAAVCEAFRARVDGVARTLTRRGLLPAKPRDDAGHAAAAWADFERARDNLLEAARTGEYAYQRSAGAAQYRRRLMTIDHDIDTAVTHAQLLKSQPNTSLPETAPASASRRPFREVFTLTSSTYRHALRETALVAVLFTVIEAMALPHGEWAVLAVVRVLRPQYGATTQRVWQRVVGNLVGGSCVAVALTLIDSPTVLALGLFVVVTLGFTLRPVNYAFWVVFGTPLILLIDGLATASDWRDAAARIIMTIVGSAAAVAAARFILPSWDADQLPELVATTRAATADYLDAVLAALADPTGDAVLPQRRAAEQSLAKASNTLERARREPRRGNLLPVAKVLDVLGDLVHQADAVGASAPSTIPVVYLDDFRVHAVAAVRAESADDATDDDATDDVAALVSSVDRLREQLDVLHAARLDEVRTAPDSETPTRAEIRNQQPTITQLIRVAQTVRALSRL